MVLDSACLTSTVDLGSKGTSSFVKKAVDACFAEAKPKKDKKKEAKPKAESKPKADSKPRPKKKPRTTKVEEAGD